MPKQMVSWRLEAELIQSLRIEADRLGLSVTELVEQKLSAESKLDEILRLVRRIDKRLREDK